MITQNSQCCFILLKKKRSQLKRKAEVGARRGVGSFPFQFIICLSRGLRKCPSRFMI